MDTTAPIACRITINNDSLYTNDKFVSLDIYAEDANDMQVWISNDGVIGTITNFELGSTVTITDSDYVIGTVLDSTNSTTTSNSDNVMRIVNWPVEDGNGARTVRVVFNDARGNKTPVDAYDTITITYDLNGNTGTTPQSVETLPGLNVYIPEIPSTGCSVFVGWSTSPTATIANYFANTLVSFNEDITLYAVTDKNHVLDETGSVCTNCGAVAVQLGSITVDPWNIKNGGELKTEAITPYGLEYDFTGGTCFMPGSMIAISDGIDIALYMMTDEGEWKSTEPLFWNSSAKNTFTAWYPANGETNYEEFVLLSDQSVDLSCVDWMVASTSPINQPESNVLALNFSHNLSMVTINITEFGSQFVDSGQVITEPKIYSIAQNITADYDEYGNPTVSTTKELTAINPNTANNTFIAIVAPGQYSSTDTLMTLMVDGVEVSVPANNEILTGDPDGNGVYGLEPGCSYTIDLKVGEDVIEINSVSVSNWTEMDIAGGIAKEIEVNNEI